MISPNAMFLEQCKPEVLIGPVTPSTTTGDFISLKNASRVCILISVVNGTTVTGSAISLTQATDVANTNGKTLAFDTAWRSLNTGRAGDNDALASFTVSSNTFTTNSTNSLTNLYAIEIKATDLDINNGFDCVRVNAGDATNATLSVVAILYPLKYAATPSGIPSSIID